jgi:hypothetical protein
MKPAQASLLYRRRTGEDGLSQRKTVAAMKLIMAVPMLGMCVAEWKGSWHEAP